MSEQAPTILDYHTPSRDAFDFTRWRRLAISLLGIFAGILFLLGLGLMFGIGRALIGV